jgi:hypothetical protein
VRFFVFLFPHWRVLFNLLVHTLLFTCAISLPCYTYRLSKYPYRLLPCEWVLDAHFVSTKEESYRQKKSRQSNWAYLLRIFIFPLLQSFRSPQVLISQIINKILNLACLPFALFLSLPVNGTKIVLMLEWQLTYISEICTPNSV